MFPIEVAKCALYAQVYLNSRSSCPSWRVWKIVKRMHEQHFGAAWTITHCKVSKICSPSARSFAPARFSRSEGSTRDLCKTRDMTYITTAESGAILWTGQSLPWSGISSPLITTTTRLILTWRSPFPRVIWLLLLLHLHHLSRCLVFPLFISNAQFSLCICF